MNTNPNHPWPEDQEEEHDQRLEVLPPERRRKPNNWVRRLRIYLSQHWNPEKLEAPKVDPDLPELNGVERSAEVFRYTTLSTEHWLSPKGYLREWLRFNAKVFACLLIPSILVMPLVTLTLGQFVTWAALIAATTASVILFPLSALIFIGLISGLVYLGKSLLLMRRMRDGRRGGYEDRYY